MWRWRRRQTSSENSILNLNTYEFQCANYLEWAENSGANNEKKTYNKICVYPMHQSYASKQKKFLLTRKMSGEQRKTRKRWNNLWKFTPNEFYYYYGCNFEWKSLKKFAFKYYNHRTISLIVVVDFVLWYIGHIHLH